MQYPEVLLQPMREELTRAGVAELKTVEDVERSFAEPGTNLVIVNSVCGCAARNARPAAVAAISHETRPDQVTTVFAGQDREATEAARSHFHGYAPSSPSIALMKDGDIVLMLERHQIEGRSADQLAAVLTNAFDEHCAKAANA